MLDDINQILAFLLTALRSIWSLMTSHQLFLWVLAIWVVDRVVRLFLTLRR